MPFKEEDGFGEGISVIVGCKARVVVGALVTAVRLKRVAIDEQKRGDADYQKEQKNRGR